MGKKLSGIIGILSLSCLLLLGGCSGKNMAEKAPYDVKLEKVFTCGSRNGDLLVANLVVKNTSKDYIDVGMVTYEITAKIGETSLKTAYLSDDNPNYISNEEKIEAGKEGKAQIVFALDTEAKGEVSFLGVTYAEKSNKQVEFFKESIELEKVEKVVSESEYEVTIDNVVATDDGEGNNLVIIDMTFTNNSAEADYFDSVINLEIFQKGMALKSGYLPYKHPSSDDTLDGNAHLEIQNGTSLKVRKIYVLNDVNAPIEVKATDYKSYDQATIIEKEIQLQQ